MQNDQASLASHRRLARYLVAVASSYLPPDRANSTAPAQPSSFHNLPHPLHLEATAWALATPPSPLATPGMRDVLSPGSPPLAPFMAPTFQILSWKPRLVVYPNFLSATDCQTIIDMTHQAGLVLSNRLTRPGERARAKRLQARTSATAFLVAAQDPTGLLDWLEERIAAVTMTHKSYGERLIAVHRYKTGQYYDSHYDHISPEYKGPRPWTRIATVLVYLSDVEEGGETMLPLEGVNGAKFSPSDPTLFDRARCNASSTYKYRPRVGDAVVLWDVQVDGRVDVHALHAGCPVQRGTKYVAVKWIRDKVQADRISSWPFG